MTRHHHKGALQKSWKAATQKLTGYHVHIYFDKPELEVKSWEIAEQLNTLFPEHVKGVFEIGIVGPHAQKNTEVEITKEGFADIVAWLQINPIEGLSVLIHPETDDVLKDHLNSAMWIGKPVAFNDNFFDRVRAAQKKTSQPKFK